MENKNKNFISAMARNGKVFVFEKALHVSSTYDEILLEPDIDGYKVTEDTETFFRLEIYLQYGIVHKLDVDSNELEGYMFSLTGMAGAGK